MHNVNIAVFRIYIFSFSIAQFWYNSLYNYESLLLEELLINIPHWHFGLFSILEVLDGLHVFQYIIQIKMKSNIVLQFYYSIMWKTRYFIVHVNVLSDSLYLYEMEAGKSGVWQAIWKKQKKQKKNTKKKCRNNSTCSYQL